jgi:hypothetical protein
MDRDEVTERHESNFGTKKSGVESHFSQAKNDSKAKTIPVDRNNLSKTIS